MSKQKNYKQAKLIFDTVARKNSLERKAGKRQRDSEAASGSQGTSKKRHLDSSSSQELSKKENRSNIGSGRSKTSSQGQPPVKDESEHLDSGLEDEEKEEHQTAADVPSSQDSTTEKSVADRSELVNVQGQTAAISHSRVESGYISASRLSIGETGRSLSQFSPAKIYTCSICDRFRTPRLAEYRKHTATCNPEELEELGEELGAMSAETHVLTPTLGLTSIARPDISNKSPKRITCTIHKQIEVGALALEMIDTVQFQRLRDLNQLGVADRVFPCGNHTRFQHSLGVYHLAGKLIDDITSKQPELQISQIDKLCVQIAGLCHDMGHGPFSHVWDGQFMPKIRPERQWEHEQGSIMMFDHMLTDNHIDLEKYGLTPKDTTFIKELIQGTPEEDRVGRDISKWWLYNIVHNIESGLDVDKLDYFQRDSYCTGVEAPANITFLLSQARVLPGGHASSSHSAPSSPSFPPLSQSGGYSSSQIRHRLCFPKKTADSMLELFRTRFNLHNKIYSHKSVVEMELMLVDVLIMASPYLLIPGKNGKSLLLAETVDDAEAFSFLKDSLKDAIQTSTSPVLLQARQLYHRIITRQLYVYIGKTEVDIDHTCHDETCTKYAYCNRSDEEIVSEVLKCQEEELLQPQDLIVTRRSIHFGMKKKNPVNLLWFYDKNQKIARRLTEKEQQELMGLPKQFMHEHIRVFTRCPAQETKKIKSATEAFQKWCAKEDLEEMTLTQSC
eukprot:gb/GEZN01002742.1/.p1 GENE.gb/GEZN01002742.1/~~gb/GEZN01002742.1/.p1  ORF type:complete len:730 (-),score=96.30 gb/GEZN01002742.1/:105-2294(-)